MSIGGVHIFGLVMLTSIAPTSIAKHMQPSCLRKAGYRLALYQKRPLQFDAFESHSQNDRSEQKSGWSNRRQNDCERGVGAGVGHGVGAAVVGLGVAVGVAVVEVGVVVAGAVVTGAVVAGAVVAGVSGFT